MAGDGLRDSELSNLTALSPLDGRYWNKGKDSSPHMSEYGLLYYSVPVERRSYKAYLEGLTDGFSMDDALEVKDFEKVSNHDVNAVEYLLKWQSHPDISKVLEFFHFACTSEDINNLAHASMLKEAMNVVVSP
ncbi:hypothetical protein OIU85_006481, partial [Salix viminalis]